MHNTSKEIGHTLRPLLVQFEEALGYTGAKTGDAHHVLLEGMQMEAIRIGIPFPKGSHSWYSFQVGFNYARHCYPNHPLDVRVYTGIFTWLGVLVDDIADKDPEQWQHFIPRFHNSHKQHSALAREWARCLRLSYQSFSPIAANFIITSALNFVNGTVLEGSEVPRVTRTAGGENWPYYLRDKNGLAEAYALFTFPKALCPDFSCYMEAIPDMSKYMVFTNDIFSFHKEECAGERDNYIHNRASYEGASAFEVLRQVVDENVDAHRRIQLVLEGKEPYAQAWHCHAMGYVAMHKTTARYKLWEIDLGENIPGLD
ncbi:terpenoid synthase [Xylariaceae sp. AK1471]|nr:terpenoid synthase [Xylariaceae sp. AK1471]